MRLIVKYHPEINIKSRSVRKRFSKLLESNLRIIVKRVHPSAHVVARWNDVLIEASGISEQVEQEIVELVSRIPGVDQYNEIVEYDFVDFETAFQNVSTHWREHLDGKTFCVRVKRSGKHDFSSNDLERYIGGGLNQQVETASVKLKNPDLTIKLELRQDKLQVIKQNHKGLGGMPIPTQEDVLSLIFGRLRLWCGDLPHDAPRRANSFLFL